MKNLVWKAVLNLLVCAHAVTAIANSVVTLSGGGDVAPKTSLSVSLTGLMPFVTYSVVCYIDTIYLFQYVLLSSNFSESTSTISSYSLNGNFVTQDQLFVGHNTAIIQGRFTSPATGYIVFTNLDQDNLFNVNNCFGVPVQN